MSLTLCLDRRKRRERKENKMEGKKFPHLDTNRKREENGRKRIRKRTPSHLEQNN